MGRTVSTLIEPYRFSTPFQKILINIKIFSEKVFDPYHARQAVVSLTEQYKKPHKSVVFYIAPWVGIEPTTNRLHLS